MLRASTPEHPTKCHFLGPPLFLRNSLLIEVHGSPAIGMPEQLLGCFDVDSFLPKHGSEAMAERTPTDPLRDSDPFQCRPDVVPENHVGRNGSSHAHSSVYRSVPATGKAISVRRETGAFCVPPVRLPLKARRDGGSREKGLTLNLRSRHRSGW